MTLLTALQLSLDWLAFSFHYSVSLSPQSTILYIPLSVHLYIHRSLFPIAIPTPSLSFQLWLLPLLSFSLSLLCFTISFLISISDSISLHAYLHHLSFLFYFSVFISYLFYFLSLPLSFPPMVLITILNSLSFQHVWYSGTEVSCITGEFFTSWAIREALFKDWHLLTDFSTLICWDFPGFL